MTDRRGGQASDEIGEVGQRFDVVALGAADEAEHRGCGFSAGGDASEEPVFATDGDGAHAAFTGVIRIPFDSQAADGDREWNSCATACRIAVRRTKQAVRLERVQATGAHGLLRSQTRSDKP